MSRFAFRPVRTCTSAALIVIAAAALSPAVPAAAATVITVAKTGSADYSTVQAAINAVPAGGSPYVISIGAGTYHEVISVPASKPNLTLEGATGNAEDVVIAFGNAAWMTSSTGSTLGTEGSATATIAASNVTVEDLTIANTYNPAAYPEGYSQAVALNAEGDKMIFNGDRFLGLQDTLLAWEPTPSDWYRQLYEDSFIEGNVDFIFGDADAVFYADNIKLADRGAAVPGVVNGYMTAPATDSANSYGFLVDGCTVSSTAADATFYLGRPWHPYTGADPQIVIRNSYLPAQIKSVPWTTMSGYSFTAGRYAEYSNTGPGSGTGAGRPQLTTSQAASYTPQAYLAGTDGWNPLG